MCETSEVLKWVTEILKNEAVRIVNLDISNSSNKHDGVIGDILYVSVIACSEWGQLQHYNLVLKCSKKSEELQNVFDLHSVFMNEIFFYESVFPRLFNFQYEKNVANFFAATPRYYGFYSDDTISVIGLLNLKECDYQLWDKNTTWTRQQIDMIVRKYATYHATSAAFKEQHPQEFQIFDTFTQNAFNRFHKALSLDEIYSVCTQDAIDLLRDNLSKSVIQKWEQLCQDTNDILVDEIDGLKVLIHGDCWNNNYMFKHSNSLVDSCVLLDFQQSRVSSPIYDLSFLLFSCISEEDLSDLNTILDDYHKTFCNHLTKLGGDPNVYSSTQFHDEWQKYAKFGITSAALIAKICCEDIEEYMDIEELVETGRDLSNLFNYKVQNCAEFKARLKYIFEFVVEHELI